MVTTKEEFINFDDIQLIDGAELELELQMFQSQNFDIPSPALTAEVEDSTHAEIKFQQQSVPTFEPVSATGAPERKILTGPYDFNVMVNSRNVHRKKYLFSHELNRIYVSADIGFSIQFSWDFKKCQSPMFIRATTVFSDESQWEKKVERCLQHKYMKQATGPTARYLANHVLRSSRDLNAEGVYYCGEDKPDSWYSVLVEFPVLSEVDNGQPRSHVYMFVCKHSCCSGINRRGIEVIFTLEDAMGIVYGRQMVGVRVCACPVRDMRRDIKDKTEVKHSRKRLCTNNNYATNSPPPSKKIHLEVVQPNAGENEEIHTIQLQVMNPKITVTGLTVMLNMMEIAVASKTDPQVVEKYTQCIDHTKALINQFTSIKLK